MKEYRVNLFVIKGDLGGEYIHKSLFGYKKRPDDR